MPVSEALDTFIARADLCNTTFVVPPPTLPPLTCVPLSDKVISGELDPIAKYFDAV
jgi:hypothetical protein